MVSCNGPLTRFNHSYIENDAMSFTLHWALCIIWIGVLDWDHGVEYWSSFLKWNLGEAFWSETENVFCFTPKCLSMLVKESVAVGLLGVFCPVFKRPEQCFEDTDGVIL